MKNIILILTGPKSFDKHVITHQVEETMSDEDCCSLMWELQGNNHECNKITYSARSMSVGDFVLVGNKIYRAEFIGFEEVDISALTKQIDWFYGLPLVEN